MISAPIMLRMTPKPCVRKLSDSAETGCRKVFAETVDGTLMVNSRKLTVECRERASRLVGPPSLTGDFPGVTAGSGIFFRQQESSGKGGRKPQDGSRKPGLGIAHAQRDWPGAYW